MSRLLVVMLALASLSAAAPAAPPLPAASPCHVLFEDLGPVGMRISEAQMIAQAVLGELNRRVGHERAVYGGIATTARQMKKMLAGSATSTEVQDRQIAVVEACAKGAPWRVSARFGFKNKKHWIAVRCAAARTPGTAVDENKVEAASFALAHEALVASLPSFCPALTASGLPPR
jgi:hypothetical protein